MKNINKTLLAAIILPLTLGSASVLAFGGGNGMEDGFDGPRAEKGMSKHKAGHKGQMQAVNLRIFKKLDLTEAQKEEIKDILQENREQRQGARGERPADMFKARQQMQDLTLTDNMDESAVRALAEKAVSAQAEKQVDRLVSHAQLENKIYNVLTAEQKTKFNQLQKEQNKKHMQRMQKQIEELQREVKSMQDK